MKTQTDNRELAPEQLAADLRALVAETEKILANASADTSPVTLAAVRERFEGAQERLTELYADAREKAIAGAKNTDATIRRHPYPSLAVALGVGVLLGALITRRTR